MVEDKEVFSVFTTNQLIDQSDNLTNELRKIQENFDHVMKSRDRIDNEIKRRLTEESE